MPDAQTVNTSDTSASDTESTAEIPEGISAVLSSSIPQRAGYTFASWNTAQDGSGKTYKPGDTIEVTADITLFAQWEAERLVQSETPEVTRAAWISSLVSTFGMTVEEDNYPDNYYSDISSSDSCYKDIMEAVEFGLISLEAGAPFEPDAAATREFAAVTMNHCLGYQFNGSSYTYSDYTDVAEEDRASVQIAVDQGWLSLTDGKFLPNEPITSAESTAMIADAQKVLDTRKAPVSDSGVEFADGVIVIPDGTDVSCDADNNIVVINCPVSISSGRIFGYWINGIPGAGKASSVTVDGDKTIIKTTTEGYTYSDCFKKLNISGDSGLYESSYSPAENTTLTTESGDRVNIDVSDYEIEKLGGAGDSKITKEIHIHPTFSVNGSNVETSFSIDIVNIHIPYKIELLDKYAYAEVDADISMSGSISIDGLEGMNTIPIGEFTTVFGNVVLEMAYNASGRITLQWKGTMGLGMEISDGKFRLIENFEKKEFSLAAEVDVKAGPRLSWDCTLLHGSNGISAQLYAEAGAELKYLMKAYDSGTPRICQTMIAWLYADAGASAECFDKSWSDSWVLYDASNSPVRSYTHVEDGVEVSSCSRGDYYCGNTSLHLDKYTYNTSRLSKYHTAVTGKYYDSATSSVVSLFKYTLSTDPDDGSKQVATITGYNGSVTNLYIPAEIDGYKVTKIGKGAFAECSLIGTISIPDCVTSIEQRAFEDCTSLTSLTLPKSLNNLDGNAFYGCSALSSVWIPKSITRCGNINYSYQGPFTDCGKLNDVKYEEGITNIPGYLFDRCSGLQSITIPDTVTEIGPNAFSNCPGLASVSLSSNLTKIRNNAFAEDSLIGTISIPDCVTSIEQRAFEDCTSLTSLTLPKSLNNLDGNAFYGCSALSSVWIPKSITRCGNINYSYQGPFTDCGKLNDVKYEEGITNIPGYLFDRCSGLQNITIPDTVTEIGHCSFSFCSKLTDVKFSANLTKIGKSAFYEDPLLSTADVPSSVKDIEDNVFYECSSLKTFSWPATGTSMGDYVFYGCSALTDVTLPKDRVYINSYTFYGCSSLVSINLPNSLQHIENNAFQNCTKLSTITIPGSVLTIDNSAFQNCDSLVKVEIPNGVQTVGNDCFYDCDKLTDVTVADSVTSIGTEAFKSCDILANVKLGTGLTELKDSTFMDCPKIVSIVIPYYVTKIDAQVFKNDYGLTDITLPRALASIGNDTFSYPGKMTIHGISGTYAQTYANLKSIKFIDTSVPVTSVTVTPTLTTLFQDKTIHLSLSVQPANMTDSIVWTSSNETVATVDTSGTVSGKSAGTATITATVGSRKATCKVTVVKPVTYIYIKADKNALTVGETLQLHGYYSPSDASSNIAYWSTDNAAVVKIDRNSGLAVAVGAGTAVITITPKIGDCKGTYTITVTGGSGDGLPFTDLGTKDWVRTAVKYVYSNGLMSGTSATTFKPNDSLTRGMFAAILYRVAGKPAVTYTSKFSDVPAGKYYSLPITWASNTGLISGYGDTGRLGPANNITRGQIAKILYLYAKSKGYDLTATADLSGFADKDLLKGNFVTYMQWAVTKGLISGSTSGSTKYLHPGDSATRAQCAKMIKQFCENCAK
ncbi:MAG: leucine-rich repeat protein [Lachnospiraceae bacterium]|nr:leucine-rich repeat protein [Lachnospiraceae bacterium]